MRRMHTEQGASRGSGIVTEGRWTRDRFRGLVRSAAAWACAAIAVTACDVPRAPIECANASVCTLAPGGRCAPSRSGRTWCQYASPTCGSGWSWSAEAGDGLAGVCVPPEAGAIDVGVVADASVMGAHDASTTDAPPPLPTDAGKSDALDRGDAASPDAEVPTVDAGPLPDGGGILRMTTTSGGGTATSASHRLTLILAPPAAGVATGPNSQLRLGW
jgi:hypothetical protein